MHGALVGIATQGTGVARRLVLCFRSPRGRSPKAKAPSTTSIPRGKCGKKVGGNGQNVSCSAFFLRIMSGASSELLLERRRALVAVGSAKGWARDVEGRPKAVRKVKSVQTSEQKHKTPNATECGGGMAVETKGRAAVWCRMRPGTEARADAHLTDGNGYGLRDAEVQVTRPESPYDASAYQRRARAAQLKLSTPAHKSEG